MDLIEKVREIEFPKVRDSRGNLSFVEGGRHVPFSIRRVFYIYDVPGGETRGGHAHRTNSEVLIAVSGSLDVILTDGQREVTHTLNRANRGLYVPAGLWITMPNYTTGTVLLVLASEEYDESGYIRDFDKYLEYASALK